MEAASPLLESIQHSCRRAQSFWWKIAWAWTASMQVVLALVALAYLGSETSFVEEVTHSKDAQEGLVLLGVFVLSAVYPWFRWARWRSWVAHPETHPLLQKRSFPGDPTQMLRQMETDMRWSGTVRLSQGTVLTKTWLLWSPTLQQVPVEDVVGITVVSGGAHPSTEVAKRLAGLLGLLVVWLITRKERKLGMCQVHVFLRSGKILADWLLVDEAQQLRTALTKQAPWIFSDSTNTYFSKWWRMRKKWVAEVDARKSQGGSAFTQTPPSVSPIQTFE